MYMNRQNIECTDLSVTEFLKVQKHVKLVSAPSLASVSLRSKSNIFAPGNRKQILVSCWKHVWVISEAYSWAKLLYWYLHLSFLYTVQHAFMQYLVKLANLTLTLDGNSIYAFCKRFKGPSWSFNTDKRKHLFVVCLLLVYHIKPCGEQRILLLVRWDGWFSLPCGSDVW